MLMSGLPAFLMMPVLPRLLGRVDTRIMVMLGLGCLASSCLLAMGLTADSVGENFTRTQLLLGLEQMVQQQGLTLTRREADAERQAGDLFETSITCYWEGDLEALVNFLHAQQARGAVSDVRQLSVQPAGGPNVPAGRLKGTFTMDYAYRREAAAAEPQPEAAGPAPAAEAAQPPEQP